jgi:hypothetical protein
MWVNIIDLLLHEIPANAVGLCGPDYVCKLT